MQRLLEGSRYISVIGIVSLLVASLAAFGWGAVKTAKATILIATSYGQDPYITVALIELVDSFLIAELRVPLLFVAHWALLRARACDGAWVVTVGCGIGGAGYTVARARLGLKTLEPASLRRGRRVRHRVFF